MSATGFIFLLVSRGGIINVFDWLDIAKKKKKLRNFYFRIKLRIDYIIHIIKNRLHYKLYYSE